MNTIKLNTIGTPKVSGGNGGSGNTINNQEKSIDITENGTTEVVADAGFTGLSKVVVNTNVPTSGEGGGSASSMEYFRVESIKELGLQDFASLLKWNNESADSITIAPATIFSFRSFEASSLIAVGIDFQSEYRMSEPFNGKLIDVLLKMGFPQAVIDSIPRITKEEFFNLDDLPA